MSASATQGGHNKYHYIQTHNYYITQRVPLTTNQCLGRAGRCKLVSVANVVCNVRPLRFTAVTDIIHHNNA